MQAGYGLHRATLIEACEAKVSIPQSYHCKVQPTVGAGDEEGQGIDPVDTGRLDFRQRGHGVELGEAVECPPGVGAEDPGVGGDPGPTLAHTPVTATVHAWDRQTDKTDRPTDRRTIPFRRASLNVDEDSRVRRSARVDKLLWLSD